MKQQSPISSSRALAIIASIAFVVFIGWQTVANATVVTFTSGTGNWVSPFSVTGTVELWGAGGGGGAGSSTNKFGGGGGAGGDYSITTAVSFTSGTSYAYAVGTAGAAGVFGGATAKSGSSTTLTVGGTTYTAPGGAFGTSYGSSGGVGGVGTSTGGVGGTIYAGGSGANGSSTGSGGGGSGAGSTGAGNNAGGSTAGAAKANSGGAGGNGSTGNSTAGVAGNNYGGGGGGGTKSVNGAAGAGGFITITYNNPVPTITSLSPSSSTAGSGNTTLTITGTNFVSSSIVHWNATALATTSISGITIVATIPTANLTTPTSGAITIFNAAPGGGTSTVSNFIVSTTTPTVTTQAASAIASTTATANGNITSTGGVNASARGYVYGTSSESLPGNVATSSSGYSFFTTTAGSFSTGAFTSALTSLIGNTTYYGRAYAQNTIGYSYGGEVSFLTLPGTPGTPTYSSITGTTLTVSWTAPTGSSTYYSLTRATSSAGTYAQVTTTTSLSYGDSGLVASTTYWYKVLGVNTTGNGSYSATSSVSTAATPPNASSVSTTINGNGGKSGDSITITGTNFGTVSAANRATCNGGASTGCIDFIVGGNAVVASASVSSWTNTSIVFTVSSTLGSNGGVSALQVWAANASDTSPLTFYIYPNITAVAAIGVNAAREYNASDTDGLIMLSGDHFGTSGTSTILGYAATLYNTTSGPCTVAGYTSGTACFEVPTAIPNNVYSGTVILDRGSDDTQATTSLSILPRISSLSPTSGTPGTVIQISGDHFCQTGTCPVSPNRSSTANNMMFGTATSSDSDFMNLTGGAGTCNGSGAAWTDSSICVNVPGTASVGSASTTLTSNGYTSNIFSFTVSAGLPTVTTQAVSSIAAVTATANGNITSIGGVNATIEGFVYDTAMHSLPGNVAPGSSGYPSSASSSGSFGTGAFTSSLTSLTGNTHYYGRAYAQNTQGYSYGSEVNLLTLPNVPGTPSYSSIASTSVTVSWSAPTGNATYYSLARATSANGTYSQITTTTGLSYSNTGLTMNTSYWYEVRGVNTSGNGSYSATSTVTTANYNAPPSTPTENSPASGVQNLSVTPTFTMTATDTESNSLQYKVTIYSTGGCSSGVVQTDDESASQTGWSGQNTSSSHEYTSGTQGSFTVQSALSGSTLYYWKASAKDPEGSNTWTDSSACNSFGTTSGLWTTDSGSWAIGAGGLTVTPGTGNYAQLHVTGQNLTDVVVEFKVSATSGSAGDTSGIFRADSGNNRYQIGDLDYADQELVFSEELSGSYSTIETNGNALSAPTVYDMVDSVSGTTLDASINGSLDGTVGFDLTGPGFVGIGASGNNTFTYNDVAVYNSRLITLSNLPGGGSWSALNHSGSTLSCNTTNTWAPSAWDDSIPIDYDAGGGSVAVWTNSTCSGTPAATYPSSGLVKDIFGGDTYTYTPATGGGGAPSSSTPGVIQATTTILVNSAGLVSEQ